MSTTWFATIPVAGPDDLDSAYFRLGRQVASEIDRLNESDTARRLDSQDVAARAVVAAKELAEAAPNPISSITAAGSSPRRVLPREPATGYITICVQFPTD